MEPLKTSSWWIQTSRTALTSNSETTTLITRLALSVNALRAQHRWSTMLVNSTTAVESSDFMQSFVTAVAYTREALNILTGTGRVPPRSREVRALAERAGVPDVLAAEISQLAAGTHPASAFLARVRNQLGFHWDPTVVAPAIHAVTDEVIVWAEGRGLSERTSVYRFAADVLVNALMPGMAAMSQDEARERIGRAMVDVGDAMEALTTYFAIAIAGHLGEFDVDRRTRWFHPLVQIRLKLLSFIVNRTLALRRR